jgi:hypothetical protein
MMLGSSPVFLAGIRANIVLLSKLVESRKEQKITNSGEIENALKDLLGSIGEKKKLIGSAKSLEELIANFSESCKGLHIQDNDLTRLFANAADDIEKCGELIEIICKFLDSAIKIFSNDREELINFGKICEDILDGDDDDSEEDDDDEQ